MQPQVHKILALKLDRRDTARLAGELRLVRSCLLTIEEKVAGRQVAARVRSGLKDYLLCLSAWSEGLSLAEFRHPALDSLNVDGAPLSPVDLALLLQNDSAGCQTGVYRGREGAAILWHTEEDVEAKPGDRFDQARIASFRVEANGKSVDLTAFIYPDLLPGPAYCWRNDGFAQAVDTLHVKRFHQRGAILANVATWVSWRLGQEVDPVQLIEALGPFVDSYALTAVRQVDGRVAATKIEFAGDEALVTHLGDAWGDFLFQANVFSDRESPIARKYEHIRLDRRRFFEKRISRTARTMRRIARSDDPIRFLRRMLAHRVGGDGAYANVDVKSYFLCVITPQEMQIWTEGGPALRDDGVRSNGFNHYYEPG
ncbi:MAG: hypothetical protein L0332_21965 [Chloroflexi bacterium]|nr:hypothetical protein [Chloroflexota bacterium]MCI0576464.1 hypothetical protein [Chloroflexota bacterium]MCI0649560.1 hypothetical protein [Chloroflexota bacterium]MCI0729364.1 hypothetical protein [Chloroflexota bacterium]